MYACIYHEVDLAVGRLLLVDICSILELRMTALRGGMVTAYMTSRNAQERNPRRPQWCSGTFSRQFTSPDLRNKIPCASKQNIRLSTTDLQQSGGGNVSNSVVWIGPFYDEEHGCTWCISVHVLFVQKYPPTVFSKNYGVMFAQNAFMWDVFFRTHTLLQTPHVENIIMMPWISPVGMFWVRILRPPRNPRILVGLSLSPPLIV